MKRLMWTLGILAVACVATAIAQSPGGRGAPGGGQGRGPGGPDGGRPPMPIIEALDADHDGVISADEIKNASAALLTLDKNKDGKLTEDELRPHPGRGPEGGRGPDAGRGPDGGRPGQGAPGRNGQGGAGGRNPNGPPPGGRGGDAGRPPEGRGPGAGGPGGRGGEGRGPEGRGPEGRGPEGREGADGPPPHNPERFLEHAMEFDADKDGKLSKEELLKFAEEMRNHRPPEGGPREGGRGPGGRPPGEGNRSGDGDRSEQPRRPE